MWRGLSFPDHYKFKVFNKCTCVGEGVGGGVFKQTKQLHKNTQSEFARDGKHSYTKQPSL